MASTETSQQTGQPHLQKQDLATLVSVNFIEKLKLKKNTGLASFSLFFPKVKLSF
jgi:hypothetical protein